MKPNSLAMLLSSELPLTSLGFRALVQTAVLWSATYILFHVVYNLFFHPLSKHPGPKFWAISRIPYNWHTLRGTAAAKFRSLHEEYGDVVRYSPNGLSYTSPDAWDEIYGPYKGKKHMEMDPAIFGGGITVTGANQITNSIDGEHRRLRIRFLRAISAKAVSSQETILQDYAEAFVHRLGKEARKTPEGVVDLAKWFSVATFNVISDLAFSKSFRGLETGELHPWITVVFGAFKALPVLRVIREIPGIKRLGFFAVYLMHSIPKG